MSFKAFVCTAAAVTAVAVSAPAYAGFSIGAVLGAVQQAAPVPLSQQQLQAQQLRAQIQAQDAAGQLQQQQQLQQYQAQQLQAQQEAQARAAETKRLQAQHAADMQAQHDAIRRQQEIDAAANLRKADQIAADNRAKAQQQASKDRAEMADLKVNYKSLLTARSRDTFAELNSRVKVCRMVNAGIVAGLFGAATGNGFEGAINFATNTPTGFGIAMMANVRGDTVIPLYTAAAANGYYAYRSLSSSEKSAFATALSMGHDAVIQTASAAINEMSAECDSKDQGQTRLK